MNRQDAASTSGIAKARVTYILPIASNAPQSRRLTGYLRRIARYVDQVIVVDGSPEEVFAEHAVAWAPFVHHVPPLLLTPNGKVGGVLTGIRLARNEQVIVADDDVRYRRQGLHRMATRLEEADVVRPQNWFKPLPWHARWDTARALLARATGGDWPGTLGIRRSRLRAAGGYRGDVLFENLEMVRTIVAAGGREEVASDLLIVRRPPDFGHFLGQRIRQAYDEFARPIRMASALAMLPGSLALFYAGWGVLIAVGAVLLILMAEVGRRMGGGAAVFPATSALWAPAWIAERAITSWLALAQRLLKGGVGYRDRRLRASATSLPTLQAALGSNLRNSDGP